MSTRTKALLDPWVIDHLRKQQEEDERARYRPVMEIPLIQPPAENHKPYGDDDGVERGVAIIDLGF